MATKREWLIAAREKQKMTVQQAAGKLRISPTLLLWLEMDENTITHPGIADRIRRLYKLTVEQRNDMVAVQYEIKEKPKKKARAEYDMVNGVKQG